jgi:thermitase
MYLPDDSKCFVDRFVVVAKAETPLLTLNSVKDGFAATGVFSLDNLCRANNIVRIEEWYPYEVNHEETRKLVQRMYIFFVAEGTDIVAAAENFSTDPNIESAEPYIVPLPVRDPNDPGRYSQWFLSKVDAREAWDIIWGTETEYSIIAIVDTGVYWTHPDIYPNMWEGIGEDMYNYDGDPSEPYPIHGTHVAGCASEATNNGIGGAGMGWSARIMAVKGADNSGNLSHVWQGITWAADNGAHIINCSWGSIGYSSYEYNIINHVYSVHDVLVVAAAGNDDYWEPPYTHYPSAYNHVLGVAATNSSDLKPSWSNYGTWVDVSAPGQNIYSTWGSSSYTTLSGTSMSSPIVAGLAGLVRAGDHGLDADETEALIESGADPMNSDYYYNQGWMGSGRINAYNSVAQFGGVDPPDPASPPNNSFTSDNRPTFVWTEVPEATVYHIQIDDDIQFTSPYVENSNLTQTSYTPSVDLFDGTWYWRIRAGDGSDWSDWSIIWNVGVDTEAPGPPVGLTVDPDDWSNDPVFTLNWEDPWDFSGIALRLYKVDSPPENDFDYDGSLPAPPADYTATSTGSHTIYIWCMDNVDNIDHTSRADVTLYFDDLPPTGCQASSPPFSSSETFTVSWSEGVDEHSGPSGLYDVRYKEDEGSWIDWLTDYEGLSSAFTGADGHIYYFEARTSDMAGNYEEFTGIAETSTNVNLSGSDCDDYLVGDFNGSGALNVADIIDAYSRLKTGLPEPALPCECPPESGDIWAVAMDVNNSCAFNVSDIVDTYSMLKTGSPDLIPCELCPPGLPIPPGIDNPLYINKLGSKVNSD